MGMGLEMLKSGLRNLGSGIKRNVCGGEAFMSGVT
jgi:hypothetical protein